MMGINDSERYASICMPVSTFIKTNAYLTAREHHRLTHMISLHCTVNFRGVMLFVNI
jgi:hypothetical protein